MKYIRIIGKAFNLAVAVVMLIALCSVDSESWIPVIVFVVSGAYLAAVAYFNEQRYLEEEDAFLQ